jgi:hypothetical protein
MRDDLDLENRRLCPDGACIGVIGPDGRCRECGRKDLTPGASPSGRGEMESGDEPEREPEPEPEREGGGAFDEDRELCPDGACVGVIGANGRCKECGRKRAR